MKINVCVSVCSNIYFQLSPQIHDLVIIHICYVYVYIFIYIFLYIYELSYMIHIT